MGCPFHAVLLAANPVRRFGDFTRWKEHDAYTKVLDRPAQAAAGRGRGALKLPAVR
jgi:hypothetical protein